MAVSTTTGVADCVFDKNATFHFRIQFYADEFFTVLAFEDISSDHPEHFLVNGKPMTADGHPAELGKCYDVKYKPSSSFLLDNDLRDQTLYIKTKAVLKQLVD